MLLKKEIAKVSKESLKKILYSINTDGLLKTLPSLSLAEKAKIHKRLSSISNGDEVLKSIMEEIEKDKDYILYSGSLKREDYVSEKRLVSSEILLFLFLHFICNSDGYIEHTRKAFIAEEIGISLATMNRALITLIRKGFIRIGVLQKGYLSCQITDYSSVFEKGSNGGYYNLSVHDFEELKKSESVQHLRLDLYILYKSDFVFTEKRAVAIDRELIMNIAPSIGYRKAMEEYVNIPSKLFEKRITAVNSIVAVPNLSDSGKNTIKETEIITRDIIFDAVPNLSAKGRVDILSLSKEFSPQRTLVALQAVLKAGVPENSDHIGLETRKNLISTF